MIPTTLKNGSLLQGWSLFALVFSLGCMLAIPGAYDALLDWQSTKLHDLLRHLLLFALWSRLAWFIQQRWKLQPAVVLSAGVIAPLMLYVLLAPQDLDATWYLLGLFLVVLWFAHLCQTLGWICLDAIGHQSDSSCERHLLAFASGAALFSALILFTGIFLGTAWEWILALSLSCYAVRLLQLHSQGLPSIQWPASLLGMSFKPWFSGTSTQHWSWIQWFLVVLIARMVLAWLITRGHHGVLNPVVGFDAVWYRMTVPKSWDTFGTIDFHLNTARDFSPGLMETYYLWGMVMMDEIAAKSIHAVLGLAGVLATGWVCRQLLSPTLALFGMALYCLLPELNEFVRSAYIDGAGGVFVVLGAWLAQRYTREHNPGDLALCGMMMGALAAFRYQGVLLATITGLVVAFSLVLQSRRGNQILQACLCFSVPLALLGGGWYLRNWIALGNPIFPFMNNWFGGSYADWGLAEIQAFLAETKKYGVNHDILGFFRSPWDFYWNLQALDATTGRTHGILPMLGWLGAWLGLCFRQTRLLAALLLGYWLSWYLGAQITRYSLPFMTLAAVLSAWMLSLAPAKFRTPFMLLILTAMLALNPRALRSPDPPLVLPAAKQAFLSEALDTYPLAKWLNRHAQPDSRVYVIQDFSWFYYDPFVMGHRYGSTGYQAILPGRKRPYQFAPPEVMQDFFCDLDIDYLVFNTRSVPIETFPHTNLDELFNLHQQSYQTMFEQVQSSGYAFLFKVHQDQCK